jgi:hypothetical protein
MDGGGYAVANMSAAGVAALSVHLFGVERVFLSFAGRYLDTSVLRTLKLIEGNNKSSSNVR